ncbi:hypothetical protein RIF29_42206 [Crotalaria pallida]|uniref:Nuclear pore complex protein NUP214 n=1 Tax=Crotalaria pallida TaxID=3830 RepID=A0AAN9E757_CROPI
MGASDAPIRIDVEEELEGEIVGTTDYFFSKIGDSLPLKANDSSAFDTQTLPSQPLALSQRFRLIFTAHSSGFYVARTKDVIDSAKEFKDKGSGSSVQQLSLVDVSIGRVRILALSTDNSLLAASVSGHIRFYSVDSFLNKEVKQSFSCSLGDDDSAYVKDMRWITTSENSYVVLSNSGELYLGEAGSPLKSVMDDVEAFDWGVKGNFVAVARKNSVLSILSPKTFEEWVSISLCFTSWVGDDSDADCNIKVDSVKCVRSDSIIIGCFQLDEDGKEENYLVQVIRSRAGKITRGCSDFIVQSFCDIYQGLFDDIVPFGSGPYLLLTYIEQCQLAINANIKNTDQHIMLLGWSVDDDHKNEVVVVDIERDNLIPRIELQENGDDNLVLGLCIDNVSIYEKVGVQLGVEEERTELSPHCVLICLTLEGKIVMFHVASQAGSEVSPEVVSARCDEEDASVKPPVDKGSTFSHGLQKQEPEAASEVSGNLKSQAFANPYQIKNAEDFTKHREVESVANIQSLKSDVQQVVPNVDLNQGTSSHNSFTLGKQQINPGQKTASFGTSIGSFSLHSHSAAHGLSSSGTTEVTRVQRDTNSSSDTQRTSPLFPGTTNVHNANVPASVGGEPVLSQRTSPLFPGHNVNLPASIGGKPLLSQRTSPLFPGTTNVHNANVPASIGGKPLLSHDASVVSPSINSAIRPVQRGGQLTSVGAGNVQPVSVSSSHLLSDGNSTAGKSSIRKFHPSSEQHGPSSKIGISSSDLSKQFGNINEMTNELDQLLRSIEEAGGFRDACTRSLQSSIETVEQGMEALSKKCKMWTCQVDEHLKEVHYLLNKTIQVMARKIYMEGIYKQASDSRYWDLWNRQKLNSELELKRQRILSLNQDLTYQLIELERHFNALELNKFSEYGGGHTGHGAFQSRYGTSRNVQSLHSLHNAISSQLVAAENLSECLSKQMADLSLRSLSEEQKNVKELFETIGLSYDASFGSPDMKGFRRTSSSKKLFHSDFTTNNDKRIQGSAMKSCESEMARRRRDSLDRSLTHFEPPKTTIKRKLLQQEIQKPNWNGSVFSLSKEKVKTSMLEESAPRQAGAKFPSIVFPVSNMRVGSLDSHNEPEQVSAHSKPFLADNFRAPTQVLESTSHVSERNNISAFPTWSASQLSPVMMHGHSTETKDLAAQKVNVVQKFDSISNSENKSILDTKTPPNSSISTYSNTEAPLLFKSSEMPFKNSKVTITTSFMAGNKPSSAFTPESGRKHDFSTSELHSSSTSVSSNLFGKGAELNVDKSQSKENVSSLPKFGGSFESPSFPTIKMSSASPLTSSVSSAALPSTAVSVASSRGMTSSNTSVDSTSESLKSESQPAEVSNLKTNLDTAAEAVTQPNEPPNDKAELKLGASVKSGPADEQSSINITSSALNVVRDSQSEKPSDAPMQFSTSFLAPASVSSVKNGGLDFGISDEDEMEEEAPETSNATELNLGSLSGFGIGTTPNPSVPKPNPFGGSFSNAATSSSSPPISFSVPGGELFRPASFSFPSPQSSATPQSANSGAFSGGFGAAGAPAPAPAPPSAFGQPAQIGSGQQVLGSVLGTFGQSRQIGSGLPGSSFGAPSGFGGGFAGNSAASGFPSAPAGGGFAGMASAGRGFAGMASAGGGFAAAAGSTVSGFSGIASAGGGFAGAAPTGGGFGALSSSGGFAGAASGGGGFGAFSSQPGSGGFGGFGAAAGGKPPELFTQMRK